MRHTPPNHCLHRHRGDPRSVSGQHTHSELQLRSLRPLPHGSDTANRDTTHTSQAHAQMHVTACLAGQKVDVEVGEGCRTIQALKEAIVVALPQLCVEGFDVSVGGRALDDDEGVVSLQQDVSLDVSANSRGLSVLALREAGRKVSEDGLLDAACEGGVSLVTLYLDAGVPIDCAHASGDTSLHHACRNGHVSIATLLLDRGSAAIDAKNIFRNTPLLVSCHRGQLSTVTLLLDRGSTAIDEKDDEGWTPLFASCHNGHLSIATLLLDRGCTAIDERNDEGWTPLKIACHNRHLSIATLLLDRGCTAIDEEDARALFSREVCEFLSARMGKQS